MESKASSEPSQSEAPAHEEKKDSVESYGDENEETDSEGEESVEEVKTHTHKAKKTVKICLREEPQVEYVLNRDLLDRFARIDQELAISTRELEQRNDLYSDEQRMRTVVQGMVIPVLTIAKENMVQNCYKNEELKEQAKQIEEIQNNSFELETRLNNLSVLQRRVVESEERINVKITKLESRFRPIDKKVNFLDSERAGHNDSLRTLESENELFQKEINDMREFVLQKQREQKDNFAKNIQGLIPEIGAVYPKMEEIRNEVNMCCAKVDDSENRFMELNSQIQGVEQKHYNLTGKLNLIREQDIADLRRRMESQENMSTDLAVQSHKVKQLLFKTSEDLQETMPRVNLHDKQFRLQNFMTHVQISDFMQEFLCIPDQVKLQSFDNDKLKNIKEFIDKDCAFDQYHNNLTQLQELVTNKQQGCNRIDFMKDLAHDAPIKKGRKQLQPVEPTPTPSELRLSEISKQLSAKTAKIHNALNIEQKLLHQKMVFKKYQFTSEDNLVEEDQIKSRINNQLQTKPQKKVIKFGSSVASKNDKKSERSNIKQIRRLTTHVERTHTTAKLDLALDGAEVVPSSVSNLDGLSSQVSKSQLEPSVVSSDGKSMKLQTNLVNHDIQPPVETNKLKLISLINEVLKEQNCSKCGFQTSKLDQFEKGLGSCINHDSLQAPVPVQATGQQQPAAASVALLGSGLPNVLREVIYVKGNSKMDRFQYRLAGKKRGFLTRQVYLAQRFGLKVDNTQANYAGLLSDDTSTDSSNESESHNISFGIEDLDDSNSDKGHLQELSVPTSQLNQSNNTSRRQTPNDQQIIDIPGGNPSKVDKTIVGQGASASPPTNNQMQHTKKYTEDKKKQIRQQTISSHAISNQNKKVVEMENTKLPQQQDLQFEVTITQSDEEIRESKFTQSISNNTQFEGGSISESQSRAEQQESQQQQTSTSQSKSKKEPMGEEHYEDLSIPDRLQGLLKESIVDLIVENKQANKLMGKMKLKLMGQINKGVIDSIKAKKMFGDATKQILVKTKGLKFQPGEAVFTETPEEEGNGKSNNDQSINNKQSTEALGKAARKKIDAQQQQQNRRMGVLDPLKIAAMSLKAQKEEDHTRLKVELEEQFSKLLLSLKTNLLKKAQIANKKMDTMIKDQREYDDEVAVKTAMKNREFLDMQDEMKATQFQHDSMFDYQKQMMNELEHKFDLLSVKIDDFIKEIQTEYIDFFKNRRMVKEEIRNYAAKQESRMDEVEKEIKKQKTMVWSYQNIIQIMSEQANMLNQIVLQDQEQRQKMSMTINKLKKADHDMGTEENKVIHPVKNEDISPVTVEEWPGSLYLKQFQFRNKTITQDKMTQYLEHMNNAIQESFENMAKTFNRLDNLQIQEYQAASGSAVLKNIDDIDHAKMYNLMPQRVFDDLMLKKKLVSDVQPWNTSDSQQNIVFGQIDVDVKILDEYKNTNIKQSMKKPKPAEDMTLEEKARIAKLQDYAKIDFMTAKMMQSDENRERQIESDLKLKVLTQKSALARAEQTSSQIQNSTMSRNQSANKYSQSRQTITRGQSATAMSYTMNHTGTARQLTQSQNSRVGSGAGDMISVAFRSNVNDTMDSSLMLRRLRPTSSSGLKGKNEPVIRDTHSNPRLNAPNLQSQRNIPTRGSSNNNNRKIVQLSGVSRNFQNMNIQNYSSLDQISLNATTQLGPRQPIFNPNQQIGSGRFKAQTESKSTLAASLPSVRSKK